MFIAHVITTPKGVQTITTDEDGEIYGVTYESPAHHGAHAMEAALFSAERHPTASAILFTPNAHGVARIVVGLPSDEDGKTSYEVATEWVDEALAERARGEFLPGTIITVVPGTEENDRRTALVAALDQFLATL